MTNSLQTMWLDFFSEPERAQRIAWRAAIFDRLLAAVLRQLSRGDKKAHTNPYSNLGGTSERAFPSGAGCFGLRWRLVPAACGRRTASPPAHP